MAKKLFEHLNNELLEVWWGLPDGFANYKISYRKEKDHALLKLNKKLTDHLRNSRNGDKVKNDDFGLYFKKFINSNLDISDESIDILINSDYAEFSRDFIKKAKLLDSTLTMENIFQGLRNVWIMHSMQIFFNKRVALTNSVFAYSILYPLTDNYLDDPSLSKKEKTGFNRRFREKIATGTGQAKTIREERIFKMIDLIESEWNRDNYPKVYDALLSILDAQNLSLDQQKMESPFTSDLLGITFYKGGTSVLADAYLIAGILSKEEELFAFYYGVILQLADDLQDIKEDSGNSYSTIMNIQSQIGTLDAVIEKSLNLVEHFLGNVYPIDNKNQKALIEFTRESIQLLIFSVILKNRKLVSRQLYNKVRKNCCFSQGAVKKTENNLYRQLRNLAV